MTDADRARIEELYLDGSTLVAIAREVGFSDSLISRYLAAWDMHNPRRQVTEAQAAKMQSWYERGVQVKVIADRMGVHKGTVIAVLRRHDVPPRLTPLSDAEQSRIAALWHEEPNIYRIAKTVGRSRAVVLKYVRSMGLWYERERGPRTTGRPRDHAWRSFNY